MANQVFNLGEEFSVKNDWRGTTVSFGLYDDDTDQLPDTADLGDIDTEPSDGNYQRQSATVQDSDIQKIDGDWGWVLNPVFDVTDTTGSADACFAVVNFQAEETGDSSANDHLVAAGYLSQTRVLDDYEQIDVTFRLPTD